FLLMTFHLIGVEYQDERTLAVSLIVAENILQFITGSVDILFRQFPQLIPGKYNVISVHQKIFFFSGFPRPVAFRLRGSLYCFFLKSSPVSFYGTEGSFKNRLQFFFLLITSTVGITARFFFSVAVSCL